MEVGFQPYSLSDRGIVLVPLSMQSGGWFNMKIHFISHSQFWLNDYSGLIFYLLSQFMWEQSHPIEIRVYICNGFSHTWWCHQMETFSALLAICAGNSPVPGKFPTQRPVTRSFDVFFDLHLNKRLSKQLWGWWLETLSRPLWRHRNVGQDNSHMDWGDEKWTHPDAQKTLHQSFILQSIWFFIQRVTNKLERKGSNCILSSWIAANSHDKQLWM